jgi:hypothetical protein
MPPQESTVCFVAEQVPCYAKPDTGLTRLRAQPRPASWSAAGHPDQRRLEEFLADAVDLCGRRLTALPDPLALRLDVGLPATTPLLDQHDLDNYLFPLASALSNVSGRRFVSVWGTKQHAESSYVSVSEAVPLREPDCSGSVIQVRTTASSSSPAFKQQIDQQLTGAVQLPEGPITLHIGFRVGPRRNWVNLWKPTIDGLDRLLGRTIPERRWHPRDGRIVELGLCNHVDSALGHDVAIRIRAQCVWRAGREQ